MLISELVFSHSPEQDEQITKRKKRSVMLLTKHSLAWLLFFILVKFGANLVPGES